MIMKIIKKLKIFNFTFVIHDVAWNLTKIWPNVSIKYPKSLSPEADLEKLKMCQKCSIVYLLTWLLAPYTCFIRFFLFFSCLSFFLHCIVWIEIIYWLRIWLQSLESYHGTATMEYLPILLGKYQGTCIYGFYVNTRVFTLP